MKEERLKKLPIPLINEPPKPLREKITQEGLEELKASMASRGLIQPIEVRPKGERYEIISGHRRYMAACELRWTHISALIKHKSDEESFLDGVHENLHREDMSAIEEGRACKVMMEQEGKTTADVAKVFKKSEGWVIARMELLDFPKELKDAVENGLLALGAVRELARIGDEEARNYYLEYAIKQGATAQLCAFWRGRWEVDRVKPSATAQGEGSLLFQTPPMEVELPCNWCEGMYPIRILNHLRFCPKCTLSLHDAREIAKQEAIDSARAEVKRASG